MSLEEALVNFCFAVDNDCNIFTIFMQIRLADGISALITSVLVGDITAELIAVGICL